MASSLDNIKNTMNALTSTAKKNAAKQNTSGSLPTAIKGNASLGAATRGDSWQNQMKKGILSGATAIASVVAPWGANTFINAANNKPSGGGGGGYYYGGGGGGGGGSNPAEVKQTANALGGLAAVQAQGIKDKFKNTKDAADRANAVAKKTMEATSHVIGRGVAGDWYHNGYENPQKIAKAMVDRAGNALSGSMRRVFEDDFARVVDDATVEAIKNELQQKNDNIYEWIQTVNKNNADVDKAAADAQSALLSGAADVVAQLINMGEDSGWKDLVDTGALDVPTGKKGKAAKASKKAGDLTTAAAAKAVKFPSYLREGTKDFYSKNKTTYLNPGNYYLTQVRPAGARSAARSKGLYGVAPNIASSASPVYLKALITQYGQRNH